MIGIYSDFGVILVLSLTIATFLLTARLCIRYQITPNRLVITWLGFRVRTIRLDMIKSISSRPVFWAESWSNVIMTKHRRLILHLESGYLKNLLITPDKPYVFRNQLEKAKQDFMQMTDGKGFQTEHLMAQKPWEKDDSQPPQRAAA